MRFMIIVKTTPETEAREMRLAEIAAYHASLAKAGVLLDGNGLRPSSQGFRVRWRSGRRTVIEGPFADTPELVAGYTLIQVKTRAEAVEWAKRFPAPSARDEDAEIEVRLLDELEDLGTSGPIDPVCTIRGDRKDALLSRRGRDSNLFSTTPKETTMRFMVMVKASNETEAGVLPSTELLAAMGKYNEELVKAGVMVAGEGLHSSSKGARVRFSGSKRTVIDGPFAEAKELVAGFWIFQVRSLAEAIEWVKKCPNPTGEESEIEIRQIFEAEDFGESYTPELRAHDEQLRARGARLEQAAR